MKKITMPLLLIYMMGFTSCDSFLSEVPDNRILIDTPEKISELLVTAYPEASYIPIAETMSDNAFDTDYKATINFDNEQSYNWEMQIQVAIDTEDFFWKKSYEAVAAANQALDAIKKMGSPAGLNPQKGEALIARAYNHFMLVSFWAGRYDPATAARSLGIPYVREPETRLLAQYKRNSVQEVFDYIEQDLTEGLKYVTNEYREPKYHFNIDAAKAFACRFYLIKGNWDKVLEFSAGLGSKPATLRNYDTYNSTPLAEKARQYSSAEQETNLLIAYPVSQASLLTSYRFAMSGIKAGEIFSDQTNIWRKSHKIRLPGTFNSGLSNNAPKHYRYFKSTNLTAGIGIPYTSCVLFSNDEMYLNRIEALVMKNRIAEANTELGFFLGTRTVGYNSVSDLVNETVIANRYPVIANEFTPFYPLTDLQASYIKAIVEARRKDFIHEGIRWFDIKRFNLVVVHNTLEFGKVVRVNVLEKDDNRRALQIPLTASDSGIEKNPR